MKTVLSITKKKKEASYKHVLSTLLSRTIFSLFYILTLDNTNTVSDDTSYNTVHQTRAHIHLV